MIKNIGIIGVGGIGGYFGGKLCQEFSSDKEIKIYFIARGNHLEEIRKNGLYLSTVDEGNLICNPCLATDNFSELPKLDLCLVCVKSYDLKDALINLKDKVSENTMIVPLLNGIDVYERIREVIDVGIVFPACVYIGTSIEKPGKVSQKGGNGVILFGKDPKYPAFIPKDLFEIFAKSKVKHKWLENPYVDIWKKFIFIASYGMVTACFNKTIGEVLESDKLSGYVLSIIKEIVSLSKKKGIVLPDDIVDESFNAGKNFPFETKTSLQRDFENLNKPDERDLFGGTIIRLGKSLNIETPITSHIYDKMQTIKPVKLTEI